MKEAGLGLEILYDLAIVESNVTETIKDDNKETIISFKNTVYHVLNELKNNIKKCLVNIKAENRKNNVEILLRQLDRVIDAVQKNDMNLYFVEAEKDHYLNPYGIIKDFRYDYFTEILLRSYRLYNSAKNKNEYDEYILFYIYSAFKKTAYDLGIRTCDVETLQNAFLLSEELWNNVPFDDYSMTDDEFDNSFDNNSGIQIESIPYYTTLSIITPMGKSTKSFNFVRGKAYYSQSVHDKLLNVVKNNGK